MFVHSGIPFLLDSQGGNPATGDISGRDAFGADPAVAGVDLLTNTSGRRHELDRSGTGSSCGDRPSRGHSFRRTDSTNSDQPLLMFSKTDDPAAYGSGQLEEGGPPTFITQGPPVLQAAESETGSSSMSTMPSASFPVADSCSTTTASMENLISQTGTSVALQSSGSRFGERVSQTSQSCRAGGSGSQAGRGESFYCSSDQRIPMDRADAQHRTTGGNVPTDCLGLWQGGTPLHVAPEQYRVVYPHQGHSSEMQRKWEPSTGQYQPPAGTPYLGTAYHWSGDWFGAEQHEGACKNTLCFDQRDTEGTSEGAVPGTRDDHARALSDSGVMSLTTDAYFSAAHSEAVSPASSVPSDNGCAIHRGVAGDEVSPATAEGKQNGVSPAGSSVFRSSSSLVPPTGNSTATSSPGTLADASCNGSLAAPDESCVLPSRTTGTSSSSDSGDSHSEGGEGSEGGDRCITELTKGNRCIRGAPRATVQQLYGQTYDLEALALEIDRTSLDAMDTGEIRREYYPGVKFPVGDLGRKLLLIAVREKMEAGTCGQLKFLTLTDLFRLAYELGMWSFALKVSMAYKAGGLRIPKGGLGGSGRGGSGRDELWCAKESRRRRKGRKSNRSRTKAGGCRVAKAEQDEDVQEDDEEEEEEHPDTMTWHLQREFQDRGARAEFGEEPREINEGHFVSETDGKGMKEWGLEDRNGIYSHGISEGRIESGESGDFRNGEAPSNQKTPEGLACGEPVQLPSLLPEEESQPVSHHGQLLGERLTQQPQGLKGQFDFEGYVKHEGELRAAQWARQTQPLAVGGDVDETESQSTMQLRARARPARVRRGKKRSRAQNFEGDEDDAMTWETDGQAIVGGRYDSGLSAEGSFSGDNHAVLRDVSSTSSVFVHPKTQDVEAGVVSPGRREVGPSSEKVARVDGNMSCGFELADRFDSATSGSREFHSLQSAGASDSKMMSVLHVSGPQSGVDRGDQTAEEGGLLPPPSDAVENGCRSSVSPADFAIKDLYFYDQLRCGGQEGAGAGRTDLNTSTLGDGNVDLQIFRPQAGGVDYSLKGCIPDDYSRTVEQEEQINRASFCQAADEAGVAVGEWIGGNQ
ncbi:conserved hypothetical protein [Neospora caninum Liverpool]|uniref:Uncharacterized protein n=1 Tax=Neospora caninum (strain Liverpool) TaxID=572307 RepID=F0VCL0_NEOCL|nr:conserved hypothetical protein [Neospora caninum Liverpool]CBZ51699.1 conserved hypothetical protein [Neospora caninum Liverpool]CEL65651.1 TPA: hypothetical protein BN1204_014940 [Neospora caninum Liverpool]|eukprot:XP_003881732.1 conserved hypothetical protein [Neospora caninum Liverpool]